MTPTEQYRQARARALEVRAKYSLTTARVMVSDLKKIYKSEGIQPVEYRPFKSSRIKGAYFNDEIGHTVVVNKKLMNRVDPKAFTLAHELKHHLMDEMQVVSYCSADNDSEAREIAAEVFAAELLYPEDMFIAHLAERGIVKGSCTAEHLVQLKHETKTTLSHTGLAKRALRLHYSLPDALKNVNWNKLRDQLYPEYRAFRRSPTS